MKEAGRKGTTSPEQRRAWCQDCRYIAPLIRSEKETLAAANKHAYHDLVHLAQSWEQGIQLLEGEMVKCSMADPQIISPYARRRWRPHEEDIGEIPQLGGLKLATFGWWEIVLPTQRNYTKLQIRRLMERIHICAVTGLPAQHLGSGLQDGSYFWEGPVVGNHQAVGILIHKSLRDQTSPYSMVPGTENRAVVVSVGQCIAQAVYSPFMGKVLAAHTKDFLATNRPEPQTDAR